MYFMHDFIDFNKSDYAAYSGVENLPNGESPKIYNVETMDDIGVDIIISGTDNNGVLLSMVTEDFGSYIIVFTGCNRIPAAVADAIIEDFKEYEVTKEAIDSIVADFDMINVFGL